MRIPEEGISYPGVPHRWFRVSPPFIISDHLFPMAPQHGDSPILNVATVHRCVSMNWMERSHPLLHMMSDPPSPWKSVPSILTPRRHSEPPPRPGSIVVHSWNLSSSRRRCPSKPCRRSLSQSSQSCPLRVAAMAHIYRVIPGALRARFTDGFLFRPIISTAGGFIFPHLILKSIWWICIFISYRPSGSLLRITAGSPAGGQASYHRSYG